MLWIKKRTSALSETLIFDPFFLLPFFSVSSDMVLFYWRVVKKFHATTKGLKQRVLRFSGTWRVCDGILGRYKDHVLVFCCWSWWNDTFWRCFLSFLFFLSYSQLRHIAHTHTHRHTHSSCKCLKLERKKRRKRMDFLISQVLMIFR